MKRSAGWPMYFGRKMIILPAKLSFDWHDWRDGRVQEKPLEVPIAELKVLHPALQRRAILEIARAVSAEDAAIGFEHVQAVLALAGGTNPGGSLDLPGGILVKRKYGLLEFRRVRAARKEAP